MLAKVDDLKSWPGIPSDQDDFLTTIITAVSLRASKFCHRWLEKKTIEAEYHDGGSQTLWSRAWPVVEVTAVKEATDFAFDDADELTDADDYVCVKDEGRFVRVGCLWLPGRDTVSIDYTGGYTDPATDPDEIEEGEEFPPADLQYAIIEQCRYLWQRRNELGLTSVSAGQGSVTQISMTPWLPSVEAALKPYVRRAYG